MANIPFLGAYNIPLYTLPYTLPGNTSGAVPQIEQIEYAPDSFLTLGFTTPNQFWLLRLASALQYNNSGTNPGDLGRTFNFESLNQQQIGHNYRTARFSFPPGPTVATIPGTLSYRIAAGQTAASLPPSGSSFLGISGPPFVVDGQLAWLIEATDPSALIWYAVQKQDRTILGWFGPTNVGPFETTGLSQFIDIKNNRDLILVTPAFTPGSWTVQQVNVESNGNFDISVLYTAGLFGYDFLDDFASAQWAQPWYDNGNLRGWLFNANNTFGDAGPLVSNGSPVFFALPDLSGFYELVFTAADSMVPSNGDGGIGPPWNYGSGSFPPFVGDPLIIGDSVGNLYYPQLDIATQTFTGVYASSSASGLAKVMGIIDPMSKTKGSPVISLPFCVAPPSGSKRRRYF
jgi:hypothetical protein